MDPIQDSPPFSGASSGAFVNLGQSPEFSYDVIVIGSGPAGCTASLYAARGNHSTLMFTGAQPGGQLTTTTSVENYPGLDNINGYDLVYKLRTHAQAYGAETIEEEVKEVKIIYHTKKEKKLFKVISTDGTSYYSKTVIVATGASAKRLHLPTEDLFWNKGISACAVCDGALPMFRNKVVVVVGGGDTACEEALFLKKFASEVVIVHRRDSLRASNIMQMRVFDSKNIRVIWNTQVITALGDSVLEGVECLDYKTNHSFILKASGLFYAIGHTPNSKFLSSLDCPNLVDAHGYIMTKKGQSTHISGMFACGDVQDKIYRQAITSAGSGCMAALDANHYLQSL